MEIILSTQFFSQSDLLEKHSLLFGIFALELQYSLLALQIVVVLNTALSTNFQSHISGLLEKLIGSSWIIDALLYARPFDNSLQGIITALLEEIDLFICLTKMLIGFFHQIIMRRVATFCQRIPPRVSSYGLRTARIEALVCFLFCIYLLGFLQSLLASQEVGI